MPGLICTFIICLIPLSLWSSGLATEPDMEIKLKTGFLHKFIQYVQWPRREMRDLTEPVFRIAVIAESQYLNALKEIAKKQSGSSRYEVQQKFATDTLSEYDVVFVATENRAEFQAVLKGLNNSPTLVVSDAEGFAHGGAMINFVSVETERGRKVRFEINNYRARQAGLKIGAQLLKLAINVIDSEGGQ